MRRAAAAAPTRAAVEERPHEGRAPEEPVNDGAARVLAGEQPGGEVGGAEGARGSRPRPGTQPKSVPATLVTPRRVSSASSVSAAAPMTSGGAGADDGREDPTEARRHRGLGLALGLEAQVGGEGRAREVGGRRRRGPLEQPQRAVEHGPAEGRPEPHEQPAHPDVQRHRRQRPRRQPLQHEAVPGVRPGAPQRPESVHTERQPASSPRAAAVCGRARCQPTTARDRRSGC